MALLPKIEWLIKRQKVGEKSLKYIYFDGHLRAYMEDRELKNNYHMADPQFFIPMYVNIYRKNKEILKSLSSSNLPYFNTFRMTLVDRSYGDLQHFFQFNDVTNQVLAHVNAIDIYFSKRSMTYSGETKFYNFCEQFGRNLLIGFIEFYLKKSEGGIFDTILLSHLKIFLKKLNKRADERDDILICTQDILSFIENIGNELLSKSLSISEIDFKKIIEAIKYIDSHKKDSLQEEYFTTYFIDVPIDKLQEEAMIDAIVIFHRMFDNKDLMAKQENSLRIFEYDLIDNQTKATYIDISDGEKQFLRFALELYQEFLNTLEYTSKSTIFLIDEIDNALHPVWKKEVMFMIINLFQVFIKTESVIKIHLIFTSHSPFLISDIPKQNIIFLDTYEDGKCKVLKHDEILNKKQTFGANIHTLLSDSFFMEDGLMGEFAKNKINEIISFHKEVEKEDSDKTALKADYENKQTKFWQTQSIIGEAYLQQIIKNHLVDIESNLLGVDEAKHREIKRLRDEADKLEGLS